MDGTRSRAITDAGLSHDVIYSISGGSGELWIGRQQGGLTHLQYNHGGVMRAQTYSEKDGLVQNSVYVVKQTTDGAVWAGTLSGGVSKFENGHFQNFTVKDGLASDTVTSIAGSPEQTMWFGTPKGLTAFSAGHWTTYGVAEELPSVVVNCLYEDPEHILWIGTAAGLARYSAGHMTNEPRRPGFADGSNSRNYRRSFRLVVDCHLQPRTARKSRKTAAWIDWR